MLQEKSQTISLVGKLFFVTITAGNEHVSITILYNIHQALSQTCCFATLKQTRSSWFNCALRGDEADN